jgi:superfamily I DNA/RNA helicase
MKITEPLLHSMFIRNHTRLMEHGGEAFAQLLSARLVGQQHLNLCDSVTIHKSQGSEYPVVVMPMFMQHYMMLSRNLLYTGLTRARKLAVLVGEQKAIGIAVKQVNAMQRYTMLGQRVARTAD